VARCRAASGGQHGTRCDLTILGGEVVFDRLGQAALAAE
jgi:hypothetical protein